MKIEVRATECPREISGDDLKLGFGTQFTDHIFTMRFQDGCWSDSRIEPYRNLTLDPAAMCFHYGQEIFEGLKAYRGPDDEIYLFRPEQNIARLNRSAKRLMMPEVPEDLLLEAIQMLVEIDRAWVPRTEGCSLYLRPTMIATEPRLGVRPSESYLLFVIASPVSAYFPDGFRPVSIVATDRYVRAAPGGVGEFKTAGNYSAALAAQEEARGKGYTQVLWLDAVEKKYIEEVSTMNVMFQIGDQVITPALNGSILPGVTRDSVLRLLGEWGIRTSERKIALAEVLDAGECGRLQDAFGTGTAAIISPIREIAFEDRKVKIGSGAAGPLAQRLHTSLLEIQSGRAPDPYGWRVRVA